MKLKTIILSALGAMFFGTAAYAQTDYYVAHGAGENVNHSTHYPVAVGIVGTHSSQQLVNREWIKLSILKKALNNFVS